MGILTVGSQDRLFHENHEIAMAKAARIYIDEEHGSYTRTEFRRLRNAEKLELMEAWFRERYEDPVNETPRSEGQYIFVWGGPYDANDEIQNEFSDFVPYHLMETLIAQLNHECAEWAPTPKYQDDPRDEEDRDATPIEPIEMGSPEELAYRDEIITSAQSSGGDHCWSAKGAWSYWA